MNTNPYPRKNEDKEKLDFNPYMLMGTELITGFIEEEDEDELDHPLYI